MVQVPLKDYVYANARVRAMAGRLLDAQAFNNLLATADFNHFLSSLDETEYGPYVEEAVIEGIRPIYIERAFNRNLVDNFRKIRSFFEGRPYELTRAILARWDLYNLKTILRGKQALIPNSEITRNLVPMGDLDEVVLGEIVSQPDLRSSIDLIANFSRGWWIPYGSALMGKLRDYFHEHDLSILELALDRLHFEAVSGVVQGDDSSSAKARKVIETEVDVINHITLLRLSGMELDKAKAREYYLPGGTVDEDLFIKLTREKDEEAVINALPRKDPFKAVLEECKPRFDEKGYSVFQDELEKYMIRQALKLDDDPLDIGVIIKYMWRKYLEVTNLRVILRGKSIGLIESQIRKEMIILEEESGSRGG
jgi:V/A-type H+-transporting ATPase subunit C